MRYVGPGWGPLEKGAVYNTQPFSDGVFAFVDETGRGWIPPYGHFEPVHAPLIRLAWRFAGIAVVAAGVYGLCWMWGATS